MLVIHSGLVGVLSDRHPHSHPWGRKPVRATQTRCPGHGLGSTCCEPGQPKRPDPHFHFAPSVAWLSQWGIQTSHKTMSELEGTSDRASLASGRGGRSCRSRLPRQWQSEVQAAATVRTPFPCRGRDPCMSSRWTSPLLLSDGESAPLTLTTITA